MSGFIDGLTNVFNQLVERRSGLKQNVVSGTKITYNQMKEVYKTGLGAKIVNIKAGYALKNTIQYETTEDKEYFEEYLMKHVKLASKFMIAFGRGVIVVHKPGDDLSKPMASPVDPSAVRIRTFSGDIVTTSSVSLNLDDVRYNKPLYYIVRGYQIHWTRVIDFTYVEPVEIESPQYQYGGISEFELVYNQLINDGIVERASSGILEKSSNFIYKVAGLKNAMKAKQDADIVRYIGRIEDMRSIYGAVLVDAEDTVESLDQHLSNLQETDQISLRRLAMVTGIGLTVLMGESPRGLNANGEGELAVTQETIEGIQNDYLYEPINRFCKMLGMGQIKFKENQNQTAEKKMDYETKAIDNALKLRDLGEDYVKYLEKHDVKTKDDWESYWEEKVDEPEPEQPNELRDLVNRTFS